MLFAHFKLAVFALPQGWQSLPQAEAVLHISQPSEPLASRSLKPALQTGLHEKAAVCPLPLQFVELALVKAQGLQSVPHNAFVLQVASQPLVPSPSALAYPLLHTGWQETDAVCVLPPQLVELALKVLQTPQSLPHAESRVHDSQPSEPSESRSLYPALQTGTQACAGGWMLLLQFVLLALVLRQGWQVVPQAVFVLHAVSQPLDPSPSAFS
jgi:hypothetical protein